MKFVLERTHLTDEYSAGILSVDGKVMCATIEDQARDRNKDGDLLDPGEEKVSGKTAIPYGTYVVELTMSPKFTRLLPLLMNVPHFTGIRIHRGNTAEDSSGCILPGEASVPEKVINSTEYEMKIVELMLEAIRKQEQVTNEIK